MTEYKMTSDTLVRVAKLAGIPMTRLYDKVYYYLELADWRRVLGESLRDMPEYCPDRRDCENLANILNSRICERYALNSMGIVTLKGQSHAINLFPAVVDGYIELYFVDPQTGQIEPLDNNVGWEPLEWWML